MSKKTVTSTQNSYDPTSMGAFQSLTPQASSALSSEINNPYSNSAFNTQAAMLQSQIGSQGSAAQGALNQSLQARGISGNSPLSAYLSRQQTMNTSGQQAQGYNNLILNAANLRQSAIGSALNYKPLQTGQTQTQTQSGTGTWLPQLAGAGLGALSGPMSSMLQGGGGNMFSGGTIGNANSIGSMDNMMQSGGLMNNYQPQSYSPGAFGNSFLPGSGYQS